MKDNTELSAFQLLKAAKWIFPQSDTSFPEVFIVESLSVDDEEKERFEGLRLAQSLRLAGRIPKYYYVHNVKELELIVPLFVQSRYRYLHISCHGSGGDFVLKDETISCQKFAEVFAGALKLRRLFVSACSMGNRELVDALHTTSKGIHSVIAPSVDLFFDHAAAIWTSLYVALLERDNGNMRHETIRKCMQTLVNLYPIADRENDIKMKFTFSGYDSSKDASGKGVNPSAWRVSDISST